MIGPRLGFARGVVKVLALLVFSFAGSPVAAGQEKTPPKTPTQGKDRPVTGNGAKPTPQTTALDLASLVQATARDTKPDETILKAATFRDEKAAQELAGKLLEESKTKKDRKPGLLEPSEMKQVLSWTTIFPSTISNSRNPIWKPKTTR